MTFTARRRLSTLIYTRLSATPGRGTAALTPGIINHVQEACLPCRRHTFPSPVTFLPGSGSFFFFFLSKFLFALGGDFHPHFSFSSCHVPEISSWLSLAMFAAESDLMSPTPFNPCKYRQQIHNLMIHIMKTGYKVSTGSAWLVLFTSGEVESL